MKRSSASLAALAGIALAASALAEDADDARLATTLDPDLAVRVAIARNPGLAAGAQRALAMKELGLSESRLPPPEVSFDVWQVPFAHPVSFADSQMISVGVRQSFPAPGSLSAREEASTRLSAAEEAMVKDRARDLRRDVEHVLVDLEEAATMEDNHLAHRALARQIEETAIARQAGGAPLSDVTFARVETASFEADAVSQGAAGMKARLRLNALLARPLDAPLARANFPVPATVSVNATELLNDALKNRPELAVSQAREQSARSLAKAADREATWPMFGVGVSVFAPTTLMPQAGYGLSASATLPWLSGSASHQRAAQEKLATAASLDGSDSRLKISVDVATALGAVKASEARFVALTIKALPAARQALDAALASYRSGQGDLMSLLRAERAVVDEEQQIIEARAMLDHALVDLDWAVGSRAPRSGMPAENGHE